MALVAEQTMLEQLLVSAQQAIDSDSAKLDALLLLEHAAGKSRTYFEAFPEYQLAPVALSKFKKSLARRVSGEPIAYIIGSKGFWDFDLKVTPATLIPRPETELLVEYVLDLAPHLPKQTQVLDIGTGSGAIALALAYEQANWQITATDISVDALKVARANRKKLGLNAHCKIIQSDLFEKVSSKKKFDVVVSNPPYIHAKDIHLKQGDLRFEPISALTDQTDGLSILQKIIDQAQNYLVPGGWLVLEHGYDQQPLLMKYLSEAGYQAITGHQDYADQPRFVVARKP